MRCTAWIPPRSDANPDANHDANRICSPRGCDYPSATRALLFAHFIAGARKSWRRRSLSQSWVWATGRERRSGGRRCERRFDQMKNRSAVEITSPIFIFAVLCVLGIPTLIVALAWLMVGICAVGYRTLDAFPTDRIGWRWLRGPRRHLLHFYHLACWPRYVQGELSEIRFAVVRRLDARLRPASVKRFEK
jgi:hypothetical protein